MNWLFPLNSVFFLVLVFSIGADSSVIASERSERSNLHSLFSNESDEVMIERLPLDIEPVSLGLFQITPEELDKFERPAPIKKYLVSYTGLNSFHSTKVFDGAEVELSSASVRRTKNALVISLRGGDLFPPSENGLSPSGEKILGRVCERLVPHLGKPIEVDVWAKDVKRGQAESKNVVSFISEMLSTDPEEIETSLQVDPNEEEEVKVQVLGLAP